MAQDIVDAVDQFMDQLGLSPAQLIKILATKDTSFLQMSDENHQIFCKLYDDILNPSFTTKEKRDKLEALVTTLFITSFPNMFIVRKNCRTSSNEIDLLVSWSQKANEIGANSEFRDLGNTFLCECKNYDGKVNVTYIGKFSSLLTCSDSKLGILVAWEGVTGTGWNNGSGLIKKIALSEKRYILVITQQDLKMIYLKKTNLFALLGDKFQALKQDIDYEKYIQKHELQDNWLTSE